MARSSPRATVPATPAGLDTLLLTGPFHAALRAAIRDRGLTLERLCWHLAQRGIRIALSTLSLWQHGHSRPERDSSLRAVRGLEDILGLPPGSLLRLLAAEPSADPAGGFGARRHDRRRNGLDEWDGPLGELLDALPGSRDQSIEVHSQHQTLVLDAARRTRLIRSRTVLRARRDGVDRHVLRYFGGPECDIERVQVRPAANCRLGQVRRHASAPVLVAELRFGQQLRAGDTWVFEDELLDGGGVCTEMAHAFRHPEAQCLLEARFDPDAPPVGCHAYAQAGLYAERRRVCELHLTAHGTVHLAATDVRAGVLGIAWEWR